MLTLTPAASEAIRQLSASAEDSDHAGIRITSGPETPQGSALELALVAEGQPEDATVDEDGATVYIEEGVAGALDALVLDASVDGGQVTFAIREQGGSMPSLNGDGPG